MTNKDQLLTALRAEFGDKFMQKCREIERKYGQPPNRLPHRLFSDGYTKRPTLRAKYLKDLGYRVVEYFAKIEGDNVDLDVLVQAAKNVGFDIAIKELKKAKGRYSPQIQVEEDTP